MINNQLITSLSLKEVYTIFSKYWNERNRIWIHTEEGADFNLKLSVHDFLHFTRIDKILKLKNTSFKKKTKYIRNIIMNGKLNFNSLEQALVNSNQHRHFYLKKLAIIALAITIDNQKPVFNKICFTANSLFAQVKPDFILINEMAHNRYIILCNYMNLDSTLNNLSHAKSLMYCYTGHNRYNALNTYEQKRLELVKFTKNKNVN